ncbi:MAG: hypothetical protein RIF32_09995, partial [Leptospirales bacterium]
KTTLKQNPTHPNVLKDRLKLLKYEGVFIQEVSGPTWIFLDWVYALATKDFSSRVKPGCYASIAALADYDGLKCSKQTIRNYIDEAVNSGLLINTPGGGVKTKTGWTNLLMPTQLYEFFRENGNRSYWWRPQLIKARGQKAAPPASNSRSAGSNESSKGSKIQGQTLTEPGNNITDRTEREPRSSEKVQKDPLQAENQQQSGRPGNRPTSSATQEPRPPADHVAAIHSLPHPSRQSRDEFAGAYLYTRDGVHWFNELLVRPHWQHFIRRRFPHLHIDFCLPELPVTGDQQTPEIQDIQIGAGEGDAPTAATAAAAENYAACDDLLGGLNTFIGEAVARPSVVQPVEPPPESAPPHPLPIPETTDVQLKDPVVAPSQQEPVSGWSPENAALARRVLRQWRVSSPATGRAFARPVSIAEISEWAALRRGDLRWRNGIRGPRQRWADLAIPGNPADDAHEPRHRRRARKNQRRRVPV